MKNCCDTIGNGTHDLPVCSAVPQPLRHRVPSSMVSYILKYFVITVFTMKGSRDISVCIATGYGVHRSGIKSRWAEIFSAPVQTCPGAHPTTFTIGTGSFPGVKRPGRGVGHPPIFSAEVKLRVELYLYSLSGSSRTVIRRPLPLF
jgi:hypothetical protein